MIEEAGGAVTRFDGSVVAKTADEIVAGGRRIHEALLEILREDRARRAS
jgi:fructose-1,6-bisphosphatase/inositol monophosphatase family enzyme